MKKLIFYIIILAAVLFGSQSSYSQHRNQLKVNGPADLSVNTFTGNLFYMRNDLRIPCTGMPIDLTFYYNSYSSTNAGSDFGYGKKWTMAYSTYYTHMPNIGDIGIVRADGRLDVFKFNGSGYTTPAGVFDSLINYQPAKFMLTSTDGTKYFFDDSSHQHLTKITDRNDNSLSFIYWGLNLKKITDQCGREVVLNYTGNHLTDITDANTNPQRHVSYEYDTTGNLTKVIDPLGNSIMYEYNVYHNMTKLTDQALNDYTIQYLNGTFVIYIISPLSSMNITYDMPTKTTTVNENVNGVNQATTYKYDLTGNVREKNGNCCGYHEMYDYDAQNNIIRKTDCNNNIWQYEYDSKGNMTKVTDPLNKTIIYTYEPVFSNVISITNKRGYTTIYYYDTKGNRIQENKPLGITEYWTYDANGNMISHTDGRGNTTNYEYNSCGDLTKVIYPDGATNVYTYDNVGNRKSFTDGNGHTTSYDYDLLNRLTKQTDALGDMTTYTYDSRGNMTSMKDIYGKLISYAYDALSRRISITNPAGTSTFTYDEKGNMLSKTNNNGLVTNYSYNSLNLLYRETDPSGHSRMLLYDDCGNLISETDLNGNLTTYMYDQLNRMIKKTDPLSQTTDNGYDENGNLISLKDARSNITTFTYDPLDRLVIETYANGSMKIYTYDEADNKITRRDQKGFVTNYAYDSRNRLTVRANNDQFTFDNEFNILTANNSNANITYTYDNVNRVTSENMNGKTTTYSYNISGRKRTINYPGGRSITEDYDNNMRLSAVKEGTNIATYTYDAGDRTLSRTYSNGVICNYTYNSNDWVTNLIHKKGSDTVANFIYTFDNMGNRLTAEKTHHLTNSEKYTYQADYQLSNYKEGTLAGNDIPVPITQTQFNYDGVGNRTTVVKDAATTTYTANNVNEYINIIFGGTIIPTYDANGNTLTDGLHVYTYDFENRLLTVDAGTTATYKYDALGRRIQKVVAAGTINYYYADQRIIEERNGSDVVQATYVYGTWIDDIINMRRGGDDYFYHQNSLGSIIAVTDNTGAVTERYEYDAYGKPAIYDASYVVRTATAIGNTYMFTGREFDAETGIFHYRARFYKTDWGRFGQWDPIGFDAGDMNLYRYVLNNPINSIDPLGLKCNLFAADDVGNLSRDGICKDFTYYPISVFERIAVENACNFKNTHHNCDIICKYFNGIKVYQRKMTIRIKYKGFTTVMNCGYCCYCEKKCKN